MAHVPTPEEVGRKILDGFGEGARAGHVLLSNSIVGLQSKHGCSEVAPKNWTGW